MNLMPRQAYRTQAKETTEVMNREALRFEEPIKESIVAISETLHASFKARFVMIPSDRHN